MGLSANLTLADIFGPSAKKGSTGVTLGDTGPNTTFTVKLAELGRDGNIDSDSPEDLSPEGILLGMLQRLHKNQNTNDAARVVTIEKATPTITQRGNEASGGSVVVRSERYTVTFYSTAGIDFLDPDFV